MGIAAQKFFYLLETAEKLLLKAGRAPTLAAVREHLLKADLLPRPLLKVVPQRFRRPFDLPAHNQMLEEIEADVTVLQKEFYEQIFTSLRRLDRQDLLLHRYFLEAKRANDLLEYQLLTLNAATGYFFGIFDTFVDLEKVDLTRSTAEIDLGTESIRLPRARSRRLPMNHLLGIGEAPFRLLSSALRSKTVSEAPFSSCFDDLTTAWQQEVVVKSPGELSGEVTFPLSPDESLVELTAVYLDAIGRGPVRASVSHSPDGVNFLEVAGAERVLDGTKVRIALGRVQAKSLRIRLTKSSPDRAESDGTFVFYFGMRAIEIHREGFEREAVFYSTPLAPIDADLFSTIDKIALTVEEDLPPGTSIEYSIAAGSAENTFIPLSPINRPRSDLPLLVDFAKVDTVPAFSHIFDVSALVNGGIPGLHDFGGGVAKRNGITFYDLFEFTDDPVFGSVELFRGLDAFRVLQREGRPETKVESDNYVVFTNEDNAQALYVNVEAEQITDHPVSIAELATRIQTRFPIINEASFRPFAAAGTHAQRPDYLVGRVIVRPSGSGVDTNRTQKLSFRADSGEFLARVFVSGEASAKSGLKYLELVRDPSSTLTSSLSSVLPLRRLVGQSVRLSYTYGSVSVDQVFSIRSINDFSSEGRVTLLLEDPEDVLRTSGDDLVVTLQSLDVTEDVLAADESGFVLDPSVEILLSDQLVVDYRRALTPDDRIVAGSLVVKDTIGGGTTYVEGRDYTFDPETRTLFRDPRGEIQPSPTGQVTVRASFRYEVRRSGLLTYETYLTTSSPTLFQPASDGLLLVEGESAKLFTVGGVIDLASTASVILPAGRHRLEVVSRPHEDPDGALDDESAIYQVVNLEDGDGELIFSNRLYFERQEAFEKPMQEVSFQRLLNSVPPEDHGYFAVSDGVLVVNYNPLSARDVFCLRPAMSAPLAQERYALGYRSFPASREAISQVVLRAVLRRGTDSREDETPTLFNYHLRVAHG